MPGTNALMPYALVDEGKGDKKPHDPKGGHDEHGANGHHEAHEEHEHEHEPSDLTLSNFGEGWNEKYEEREREGRAVRLPLFGVRKGFLTRELFLGYEGEFNAEAGELDRHSAIGGVSLPLNRRFELAFEPSYSWLKRDDGSTASGARYLTTASVQLIDTHDTAVNVSLGVLTPNSIIATHTTELEFILAGWQDLGHRWAVSGHIGDILAVGPRTQRFEVLEGEEIVIEEEREAKNRLTYGAALAKTLTDPCASFLADFTVVAEAFGTTDLDGTNSGRTDILAGAGAFFNLGSEKSPLWLSGFIATPVTGPRSSDAVIQFTLRKEF